MIELEVCEHSVILDYILGYDCITNTYVIYTSHFSDITTNLIGSILDYEPNSFILIATEYERAKGISNSPQWLKCLAEYNCE